VAVAAMRTDVGLPDASQFSVRTKTLMACGAHEGFVAHSRGACYSVEREGA